ncbi:MAG: hypothetical protein ACTSUE_03890 [Promethearchaeota archaeon]
MVTITGCGVVQVLSDMVLSALNRGITHFPLIYVTLFVKCSNFD